MSYDATTKTIMEVAEASTIMEDNSPPVEKVSPRQEITPVEDQREIHESDKNLSMEEEDKDRADVKEPRLQGDLNSEANATNGNSSQKLALDNGVAEKTVPPEEEGENSFKTGKEGRPKSARHVTYSDAVEKFEMEKESRVAKQIHSDETDHLYRAVFRNEMHRLHRELETFKEQVAKEYDKNARRLERKKKELEEELSQLEEQRRQTRSLLTTKETDLNDAEKEDDRLQRKQALLDEELLLLDREEKLSSRQRQLEAYEAEIENIEGYVERRMSIAKRRTTDLMELDEDLRSLQQRAASAEGEQEDGVDGYTPPSAHQTAMWDEERRRLLEKQAQTDLALKKNKADFIKSENSRESLQTKLTDSEKHLSQAEKRIKELESKLALISSQGTMSLSRRPTLYATPGGLPNGDAQSLGSSMTSQRGSIADAMNPVRFSVKVNAVRKVDTGAPVGRHASDSAPGDAEVFLEQEKPALAWQRYGGRRRTSTAPGRERSLRGSSSSRQKDDVSVPDIRSTVSEGSMGRSTTCSIQ